MDLLNRMLLLLLRRTRGWHGMTWTCQLSRIGLCATMRGRCGVWPTMRATRSSHQPPMTARCTSSMAWSIR